MGFQSENRKNFYHRALRSKFDEPFLEPCLPCSPLVGDLNKHHLKVTGLLHRFGTYKIFVSMLSISRDNDILVSAAICNFLLFPINKFKGVQGGDIILGGGCSLATSFWGGGCSLATSFGGECSLTTSFGGCSLATSFGGCSLATSFWGGAVSQHHFGGGAVSRHHLGGCSLVTSLGQGCSLATSFWGGGGAVS